MQVRTPADLLIEARRLLPGLPDWVTDLGRPHHLLMPGVVNAHTHAAMTLFRALPVRTPLWDEYRAEPWGSLHFAPHAPYSVSDETLRRVQRVADELDARVAMHVHESETEIRDSLARHGVRPLQRLADHGLPRPGVAVVACPQSNLRLGTGLATDAPPSCGALDLLAEARTAALIGGTGAHTALRLATLGGAVALGLQREIGSLETGKAADLLCGEATETAAFVAGGRSLAFDIEELREIAGQWRERFALEAAA